MKHLFNKEAITNTGLLLWLLCLLSVISFASNSNQAVQDSDLVTAPFKPFSGARAYQHVKALASPQMEGRQSGLPGALLAESYVAKQFKGWGLKPVGDDGGFFQTFPLLVTKIENASMKILDTPFSPIPLTIHEDFYPLTNSGSGDLTGEAAFIGYGISKPDKGWDDYVDADIKGKVAIIVRGKPPLSGQDWSLEYSRNYTVNEAYRRGAAAVLFLQGLYPIHGAAIQEDAYHLNTPMAYIAEHVADKLLIGSGYSFKAYTEALKAAPKLVNTGHRISLNFSVKKISNGKASNVVAMLPGADPALKNEYIIIGGHLDHLGQCPNGEVFAGANDNASGSSVVLELARAFSESRKPPARSMIFALFAAEEQGLMGSEYMASHLPEDIKKEDVVVMINYDMAGHGSGDVGFGGGEIFPLVWRKFMGSMRPGLSEKIMMSRAWGGGSDQASFRNEGMPVFSIWSRGNHLFYHTISDVPALVKPEVLGSVGEVSEAAIRYFADWPSTLTGGYHEERRLLGSSCQVDFSAAWTGLGESYKDWTGPLAKAPVHMHGALWNIGGTFLAGGGFDPGLKKISIMQATDLFRCIAIMKTVTKPFVLGKTFSNVYRNTAGQAFTLLPCITPSLLFSAGHENSGFLRDLGACFMITETSMLDAKSIPNAMLIIAKLSPNNVTLSKEYENLIILCAGNPSEWIDSAKSLIRNKEFFVIRVNDENVDIQELNEAINILGSEYCHLDLTGIRKNEEGNKRLDALFQLINRMKDGDINEKTIKNLIGGNLLRWPSNIKDRIL